MREKKEHLHGGEPRRSILLHSLEELKNRLIQQGRYAVCVDELIFKVVNAPIKRMKIEYVLWHIIMKPLILIYFEHPNKREPVGESKRFAYRLFT